MQRTMVAREVTLQDPSMLVAIVLAAAVATNIPDCSFDGAALLALDQASFDQDLKGGRRAVANRPGCELAAADLLRDYRLAHPRSSNLSILYWHEGQVRAMAGDARGAVPLLEQSHKATDAFGWNPYVDATVAFLNGDKVRLEAAWHSLAAIPAPANWEQTVADAQAKFGTRMTWPPNLDVVDGLITCFGRPYREAYGAACRKSPSTQLRP